MQKTIASGTILAMLAISSTPSTAWAQEKVSKPGQYSGYSQAIYDGYKLTSQYVPMRDGTKIAVDVIRPTLKGLVVNEKLPVLFENTPYSRRSGATRASEQYDLVKYGYVVVIADMRGTGASFGRAVMQTNRNEWMPWAYWDAYDLTEWIAAQPWSSGKEGTLGCSAVGHSQWQIAATAPPHVKAIFPMSAPSEYYDWNGATDVVESPKQDPAAPRAGQVAGAGQAIAGAVPNPGQRAAAVDEDKDGSMLKAAQEQQRTGTIDPGFMQYRDSTSQAIEQGAGWKNFKYWEEVNTFNHFKDINKSGIPAYETANFGEDMRVKLGVMVKLRNVTNPMKLVFAPGDHCNWTTSQSPMASNPFNIDTEQLRWYDYWLKGVQNGIMEEPPIYIYTYNKPKDESWRFSWQWPLPNTSDTQYFFGPAATGGMKGGVVNGTLGTNAPTGKDAKDDYTTDYTITTDTQNEKGLTYTTPALAADTTLIGDPVLHLWIASTATDGDFTAYLADVAPDGKVTVLPGTDDGRLRASMRALNKPSYDNLGLPYHRSYKEDEKPLTPGQPAELVFDIAPVSYLFKAGHQIRVIIACVAAPHHKNDPIPTPIVSPPPVVSFLRDSAHASYVTLPIIRPLRPSLRVVSGKNATSAYLTFPKTVDKHYLSDLKSGSLKGNGMAASEVKVDGNTLVAEFLSLTVKDGESVTVEGEMGGKYDYGSQMMFTATAKASRK